MSDRIAEKDITRVNGLGQRVLLVAAGQPIPDGVEVPVEPAAKRVAGPPEDKAARGPAGQKRKR